MFTWVTDLHLDRGGTTGRDQCIDALARGTRSLLLITGDISNASRLITDLETLGNTTRGPLYFTLGNHDHYGSSIARVRDAVIALAERRPTIQWLPRAEVVRLDRESVLVGVDGWADGRHGEPLGTPLVLNDDRLIAELSVQSSRAAKLEVRRVLADADAARLRVLLDRALVAKPGRIVVATHVPPFVEALRPGSRAEHPDFHPLMICGATGAVLREFAEAHPAVRVQVLCGHTHAPHQVTILPNLEVTVGVPRKIESRE